jgi:hypothetical protein
MSEDLFAYFEKEPCLEKYQINYKVLNLWKLLDSFDIKTLINEDKIILNEENEFI